MNTIDDVRSAIESAENAGDAEAAIALFADEAVAIVPDYPVQEGKAACAAFMREIMPSLHEEFERTIRYRSDEVTTLAPDLALDRGTFEFTIRPRAGGDPHEVTGKYLWILRRETDAWRIARLIVTRDATPEPLADTGC